MKTTRYFLYVQGADDVAPRPATADEIERYNTESSLQLWVTGTNLQNVKASLLGHEAPAKIETRVTS